MGKVMKLRRVLSFGGPVGLIQLDRDYFATVSGDISQFGGSPTIFQQQKRLLEGIKWANHQHLPTAELGLQNSTSIVSL